MPDDTSTVGGAYVDIRPDFDTFEEELEAGLEEATQSTEGTVEINADLAAAEGEVDAFVADTDAKKATIEVEANTAPAAAEEAGTEAPALGPLGLADLGIDAAAADEAISELDSGVVDFNRDLGETEVSAGAVASQFNTLRAGAEAAGLSTDDFSQVLSRAGISFSDISDEADRAGVSTETYAAALGSALAAGNNLGSFFQAVEQGDVSWNHYASDVVAGSEDVSASLGRVRSAGLDLTTADPSLQLYAQQAASALAGLGLATTETGGLFRSLEGDLVGPSQLLSQFGISTADGIVTVGDLNAQLSAFAEQGLAEVSFGLRPLPEDLAALGVGASALLGPLDGGVDALRSLTNASNTAADGAIAFSDAQKAVEGAAASFAQGMTAAASADVLFAEGMSEVDQATLGASAILEELGLSAEASEADLAALARETIDVSGTLSLLGEAAGGGGGGGGGAAFGTAEFGKAMADAGLDASTLLQVLLTLSPVIVAIAVVGVEAAAALGGAFLTLMSGIGVFALVAVGQLSSIEGGLKAVYEAWDQMVAASPQVQGALAGLSSTLQSVLSAITPLVNAAASGIEEVEQSIRSLTQQADFQQFVSWLGTEIPFAMQQFVTTMSNFAAAFSKAAEVGAPFMNMIIDGLDSLSEDLEKFSMSNGFAQLIGWLEAEGPKVGAVLSNLWGAFESLLKGFSEAAVVILPVVDALTKLLDVLLEIPGMSTVVAGILAVWGAFSIGTTIIGGISTLVGGAVTALGALGAEWVAAGGEAEAGAALTAAAAGTIDTATLAAAASVAAPLLLIVAAMAAVGIAAFELADHWSTVWSGITDAATDVGDWFSDSLPHFFESGFDSVASSALSFGHELEAGWDDISGWATSIFGSVLSFFESLPDKMLQIGTDIIDGLWDGLRSAWDDVFGWLEGAANGIIQIFKDVLSIFSPSGAMEEIGLSVMEGLGGGLVQGWSAHVGPVLQDQAASVLGAFAGIVGTAPTIGTAVSTSALNTAATVSPIQVNFGPTTISGTTSNEETAALVQAAQDRFARQLATVVNIRSRGHS